MVAETEHMKHQAAYIHTALILTGCLAALVTVSCDGLWPAAELPVVWPQLRTAIRGFGYNVTADDVNGDGVDDLVIASPVAGTFPRAYAGDLHLLLGPQPSDSIAEAADLTVEAQTPVRYAGAGLAMAEMSGDGRRDVVSSALLGSPWENMGHHFDPNGGSVYVIDSSLRGRRALEGSAFLTLEGPASFGAAMAAVDYNGDGQEDMAVACPLRAEVYVVYGPRSGVLTMPEDADVVIRGPSGAFGSGLAAADVDERGCGELVVSDYINNAIYVVPGGLSGEIAVEDVALAAVRSDDPDVLAYAATVADLTGDGRCELIVAARLANSETVGRLFVIRGPLRGELSLQKDSVLVLDDVDRGQRQISVDVSGPVDGGPALLAIGLSGRRHLPESNKYGEVWVIPGDLQGRYGLNDVDSPPFAWRLKVTELDDASLDRLGTVVLFAETQEAGRVDLVVSARVIESDPQDFGQVMVFSLER